MSPALVHRFSPLTNLSGLINNEIMALQIKLYVSDACEQSALRSLQEAMNALPDQKFEVAVINVKEHPDWAEEDNVVATPTIIKLDSSGGSGKRLLGCKSVTLVKHFLVGLNLIFPET